MDLFGIIQRIQNFFKTKRGKRILRWVKNLLNAGVIGWLIYQLSVVGWDNFWHSLPNEPLFYILFLFPFFELPLFEVCIYRLIWKFDPIKALPVFILKRTYNRDIMDYAGELYFWKWAKKTLDLPDREILAVIKDNNIISSVASTFVSFGLVGVFLFTGQIKIIQKIAIQNKVYFSAGIFLVVITVALFIKFRHKVISISFKIVNKIFGIQVFRLLLGQLVNLLMFHVVLPREPLYIWFTFIAVQIILSRIPFLPNRNFIFASLSISMAGGMAIPKEAIAGIVITKGVLNKIGGLAFIGISMGFMRQRAQIGSSMRSFRELLYKFLFR